MRTLSLPDFRQCIVCTPDDSFHPLRKFLQALLIQQGVETALPEQPWTEPCAVVILPAEPLPSSPEEPAN